MNKRFKLLCLSSLMLLGLGTSLVSCGNTNKAIDYEKWDDEESRVIFERRLWGLQYADSINNTENKWSYNSEKTNKRLNVSTNDQTVYFRYDNDSITTEKFETNKPFSVDITMSLNQSRKFPTGLVINKGELVFAIEALNEKGNVVSKVVLDEMSEFPKEKEMSVIRVHLNEKRKKVTNIRFVLEKKYYNNYIEVVLGIGRVKAYEGKQTKTTLEDGVTSDYESGVHFQTFEATNYEESQAQGIKLSDIRKDDHDLKSKGNQKVLVIPVKFLDTKEENLNVYDYPRSTEVAIKAEYLGGFDGIRRTIERAYFGASEETGWESLSSYYYKSSGGKLSISGKVSEWYTYPKTVMDFYNETGDENAVYNLVTEAVKWYKANFDDYDEFDQDKDGYFDCVEFVYAQPNCNSNTLGVCSKPKSSDLFWAFCWRRTGYDPVKNWAMPFTFAWFSYDFLYNAYNQGYSEKDAKGNFTKLLPDTHTVLHENGHALGLMDYYSTGYDGSSPLSGIDMMDNNVGDHNAYSKWQFDWYGPKEQIIYNKEDEKTKEYRVELRPFESSGDFAIIPAYSFDQLKDGKNPGKLDSSFGEYITIEYYTPTGLNEKDSLENYEMPNGARTMTENGIKMLHVDSRLAYISSTSAGDPVFSGYLPVNADKNYLTSSSSSTITLAHLNDATERNYDTGTTKEKDYRLISSLFANGQEDKKNNKVRLSNEHLWGSETSKVMDFGITNHENFVFNNGYSNVYSMEIESINQDKVVLVFKYIGK